MEQTLRQRRLEIGLLFLLIIVIIPRHYYVLDMFCWRDWALDINKYGIAHVYNDTNVNYHPIYLYALYVYDLIQGSTDNIIRNINYIKFFPLLFDFLPVIVLCCFRKQRVSKKIPYLFLLLNIAYLYNSIIWGQVDSIPTNLAFLSILAAFTSPVTGSILFALALGTKMQAVIFVPVLLLIYIYSIRSVKQFIAVIISSVATLFIVALPFIISGTFSQLWHVITHAVGFYPVVSMNAFNMWYFFVDNPTKTADTIRAGIFTYKQAGLLLFLISSAAILLPVFIRLARMRINRAAIGNNTYRMIMLGTGMIALCFFYFNTQMHERYSHPILIFFFFYGVFSKNYRLYILASAAYFLNLEFCFPNFLPLYHPPKLFYPRTIAFCYTITLLYGMYLFFRDYNVVTEYKALRKTFKNLQTYKHAPVNKEY